MMAERLGGRYLVASFRGRWRALSDCPHISRDRIVWRSWKTRRQEMLLQDTEANREIARTTDRKKAAEMLGVNVWQFEYACKVYGWETKKYGKHIDIAELREAMKVMTAGAYATQIGVYATRIYGLCKKHHIDRPHRDKRGKPREKGSRMGFHFGSAPRITPDMVREGLAKMTALDFAKVNDVSVSWVYVMCKKYGIERKIRNPKGVHLK